MLPHHPREYTHPILNTHPSQGTALAFAERMVLDAVVEAAAAGQGARQGVGAAAQGPPSAGVAGVLRAVGRLFALRAVEADLPWFIAEGELPAKVGIRGHGKGNGKVGRGTGRGEQDL